MSLRIEIEHDVDLSVDDFAEEIREEVALDLEANTTDAYITTVYYSTCEYADCPHHGSYDSMGGTIEESGHTGTYGAIEEIKNKYLRELAQERLDNVKAELS